MPAPDLDAFLDGYELPVEEVPICGRAGLVADHAAAEAAVLAAQAGAGLGGAVPQELLDRIAELEAEIEASVMVFRVQAVTQRAWADLLAGHPPCDEDRKKGLRYHPETFDPAALAECSVEPAVSFAQAQRLRDTLPPSEWARLMVAVLTVNNEATSPPKSLLLSALRMSAQSSTTPPIVESPDRGSLVGSGGQ